MSTVAASVMGGPVDKHRNARHGTGMLGWTLTQVALGGALGAMARYGTQMGALRLFGPGVPLGTLAINVAGSFIAGMLSIWLVQRGLERAFPLLIVGFLGSYTTFATYSRDAIGLWDRGHHGWAVAYAGASVVLSVAAAAAGVLLMRGVNSG